MKNMSCNLEKEETELLESIKNGNWVKSNDLQDEIHLHQQYAKNHFKKDKKINIKLTSKDFELIQRKAIEEGVPYQSLVTRILHKYVNGNI